MCKRKITSNFLVISAFNHDLAWVPEYTDNYLIYDRSPERVYADTIHDSKVIISPNVGYNSYDYFRFIVDHYDNLPDCTIFAKGWSFPRHVRQEQFDRIMNNRFFTPIEDPAMHKPKWPVSFFAADGGFSEINNSWYLRFHPTKYFHNYNDFLRFCFVDPIIPRYNRFAPGGDYIVPRENILKFPKVFYENLKLFLSHHPFPGETHIVERAMHTLWTCNFEISENMLKLVGDDFVAIPAKRSFLRKRLLTKNVAEHEAGINKSK